MYLEAMLPHAARTFCHRHKKYQKTLVFPKALLLARLAFSSYRLLPGFATQAATPILRPALRKDGYCKLEINRRIQMQR